jgi:hypothetical protein
MTSANSRGRFRAFVDSDTAFCAIYSQVPDGFLGGQFGHESASTSEPTEGQRSSTDCGKSSGRLAMNGRT